MKIYTAKVHCMHELYNQLLNMIDQFVKKIKMEKYPDILNKIQKQYNKWKRGKK